ncbi:MAG: esterase family protein [Oscillospiraceae bacterium]|nr:esterase family protein [Oscillospiraceae bacterium]
MKNLKIILAVMLAVCLSGCQSVPTDSSGDSSQNNVLYEESAETSGEQIADEPITAETEETYMEQCNELLTEMPPEEILEKRDGSVYPRFEKYTYYSRTAERDTPVNVLLPAGYSEDKEYPVLYILHGYYDNQDWMAREIVHIPEMLTNLAEDGAAAEMIVVLPYIYCSKDMPYCTGMDTQNTLNYDNFINDMTTDLMPFIEENFSAAKGRENTAITGFSMGGRESLFIGISHPELFGYIGAVCPAPGLTKGSGDPWQLEESELVFNNSAPYLLLISAAEHDGVVGGNPARYESIFTQNNVDHLWHTMSSTGHDASSVTPHLYNFLRLIFR